MMALLLLLAITQGARALDVPGSACSGLLSDSFRNVYSSQSSGVNEQAAHTSFCSADSSYTYDEYQTASSSSSGYGKANAFNLAASYAQQFGLALGFSSSGQKMDASQFAQVKTFVQSYQKSLCAESYSSQYDSQSAAVLSSVVPPEVFSAYTSCIAMYQQGVKVTQTDGIDSTSTALDIVFTNNAQGAVGKLTGVNVQPPGSATCRLFGTADAQITDGTQPLQEVNLLQDVVYSVFCALVNVACVDPNATVPTSTTVTIHTSPGGTYRAILKRAPALSQLQLTQSQLQQTQSQLQETQSQLLQTQSQLQQTQSQLQQMQSQLQQTQSQLQQTQSQLQSLQDRVVNLEQGNFQGGITIADGYELSLPCHGGITFRGSVRLDAGCTGVGGYSGGFEIRDIDSQVDRRYYFAPKTYKDL